jgi:hypothetical protein
VTFLSYTYCIPLVYATIPSVKLGWCWLWYANWGVLVVYLGVVQIRGLAANRAGRDLRGKLEDVARALASWWQLAARWPPPCTLSIYLRAGVAAPYRACHTGAIYKLFVKVEAI